MGSVLLCEAAGGMGGFLSREGLSEVVPRARKPSFNPPGWVFGPVWTLLYAMLGVSLYIGSRQEEEHDGAWWVGSVLFGLQLVLNVLWSYVFFGRRSPGRALVEIAFLWVAIAATTAAFWKISRTAGLLLLPYLLWTTFAGLLNGSIWRLNR